MLRRLLAGWNRFVKAQSGNVSVIFGLAFLPMVLFMGSAIDYSRAAQQRARLDNAADSAALAGVNWSIKNNLNPPSSDQIKSYFYAMAGTSDVTINDVTVTTSTSVTSVFVTVNYTASVKTSFMQAGGFQTITVGGSATSAADKPKYVNFYLMLDNSPSMGLGATSADIAKLQSLTPDSCAFACHMHTFNSSGQITGDNTSDYYHIAKNNGVQTRIDVLRTATQNLAQSANDAIQITNQFKMAVYTFSDVVTTISTLSTNLINGSPNVKTLAGNIDLAYAYYDQRDTQTSFDTALSTLNSAMPTPGDGSSSLLASEFLFIVTDGVQDQPVGSKSGTGDKADTIATNSTYFPPSGVTTLPNLYSAKSGNVSSARLISVMDTSTCTTIKNRNIRIAVLYTPYLPVTNNSFYNSWVAPISSSIPTQLQACASPGFYFQITPTQGINEAMQAMFKAALSAARITQ